MKNSKLGRILLLLACAVLLVCLSVGATLAYLTSSETNTNVFTTGKVHITLTEAKVTEGSDGLVSDLITPEQRGQANNYHMQPGLVYAKDPTVTVLKDSENCYVRMLVTVNNYDLMDDAFPVEKYADFWWTEGETSYLRLAALVVGWEKTEWPFYKATISEDGKSCTYEFRYKEIVTTAMVDQYVAANEGAAGMVLDDLFETVNPPAQMTNTEIANLNNTTITVVAQAIQADNFTTADAAWAAYDGQHPAQ